MRENDLTGPKTGSPSSKRQRKWILFLVGILYLATWIWGIPAVHTGIAQRVVGYYKQAREKRPEEVRQVHPRIRFGASYVILPCVVVTHYEYQVAALWGWGGISVDIWYFGGSVTIFGFTKWVS